MGGGGDLSGASWANKIQSSNTGWTGGAGLSTAGTAYINTLLSSLTFNSSSMPTANSAVDFTFAGTSGDLTTLVQSWNGGSPSFVMQTSTPGTNTNRMTWQTREVSGGIYAPQLLIDYAVVPEPSTWALLAFSLTTVMVLRRRRS